MERKIGEIFEVGGEWYQCFVGNYCKSCAFNERKCYSIVENGDPIGECCADRRKDNKDVFFKKLEKVGEPYKYNPRIDILFQCYKLQNTDYTINCNELVVIRYYDGTIGIEIKQTKEDMEEKKLNLKPFDIQKAREGEPVCTRDGRKARIICFDRRDTDNHCIVALIEDKELPNKEGVRSYFDNGKYLSNNEESVHDLMILPEKKEGWMNIYSNGYNHKIGALIYNSKEEALNNKESNAIDTVKIEWEE